MSADAPPPLAVGLSNVISTIPQYSPLNPQPPGTRYKNNVKYYVLTGLKIATAIPTSRLSI